MTSIKTFIFLLFLGISFKVETLTLLDYKISITQYKQFDPCSIEAETFLFTIENNAIDDIEDMEIEKYLRSKELFKKFFMIQEIINLLCNDQVIINYIYKKMPCIIKLSAILCPLKDKMAELSNNIRKKCFKRLIYINEKLIQSLYIFCKSNKLVSFRQLRNLENTQDGDAKKFQSLHDIIAETIYPTK